VYGMLKDKADVVNVFITVYISPIMKTNQYGH